MILYSQFGMSILEYFRENFLVCRFSSYKRAILKNFREKIWKQVKFELDPPMLDTEIKILYHHQWIHVRREPL